MSNKKICKDSLTVFFAISNVCNYSCDYCIRLHERSMHPCAFASKDNIDKLVLNIRNYNLYDFIITGGEPSICENTHYLLDKLKDLDLNNIIIHTNSSNLNFYIKCKESLIKNIRFIASVHLKYYNDSILKNLKYRLCCNILLTKGIT